MNFAEIKNALAAHPLFGNGKTWKLSPDAFPFTPQLRSQLDALGNAALAFYRALERLYLASANDQKILRNGTLRAPWVAPLLDRGKPPQLVAHQRAKSLAGTLPPVIRPDLLICNDGFALTEFDSVPGGIGLTAFLNKLYALPQNPGQNSERAAETPSMLTLFFDAVARGNADASIAVAVSDESADYRPEFEFLAEKLRAAGKKIFVCHPNELQIRTENPTPFPPRDTDGNASASANDGNAPHNADGRALRRDAAADGVFLHGEKINVIYRFFELFDLGNVAAADALFRAVERGSVAVLPPMRAFQEEKMSLALLHHPTLFPFWQEALGEKNFAFLTRLVPETRIVEPTPERGLPASAVLLAPTVSGRAIRDWHELADAPRRDRDLVLKASGFDATAWGARSVTVGCDASQSEWRAAVEAALASAREKNSLFVVQRFRKPMRLEHAVFDAFGNVVPASGRVRICPYYFVIPAEKSVGNGAAATRREGTSVAAARERVVLGGALCTFCPADKKIIHGMSDAVLVPCAF